MTPKEEIAMHQERVALLKRIGTATGCEKFVENLAPKEKGLIGELTENKAALKTLETKTEELIFNSHLEEAKTETRVATASLASPDDLTESIDRQAPIAPPGVMQPKDATTLPGFGK